MLLLPVSYSFCSLTVKVKIQYTVLRCGLRITTVSHLPFLVSVFFLFIFLGKLTQCVFGHWDVVTCLAYSRHVGLVGGDAFVVSGSRDATVLVWRWNERLQRVSASDRAEGEY